MNKPKIAILTLHPYDYGGVLTSVKTLYKFAQQYFDPTLFYLNFDPKISTSLKSLKFKNSIKKTTFQGMNAVEVGARHAFWEPGHYVYTMPLWREVLKDYDYFLFESGTCIAAYPLVKLNKKFAMVLAASYKDDRNQRVQHLSFFRKFIDFFAQFKMQKMEKIILDKADYILPISSDTKKRVDQIIGFKRENIAICGFPISTKIKNKNLSESKNIIAVGRFADPRKNFDMLMRAFANIYQQSKHSQLYVVGKKPENIILEKYSSLSFYRNIIFTGILQEKELNEFYEIADLILITSYQEGLGIIGLEAMSYGIPVVATDCGGTRDYVINGKNGFLVKIDDDKDMADRALEILLSSDLYKKFSDYALNFIKDSYSQKRFESIIKYGLLKVYPELREHFYKFDSDKESLIVDQKQKQREV